jgi:hypothetical protein
MQLLQRQLGNDVANRLDVTIVLKLSLEFRQDFAARLKRFWAE